jgi:hypothetical protein
VPFDFIAAGTSLATAALPELLGAAAADAVVEAAVELDDALLLLLLLLPHAAMNTALSSASPANSDFLRLLIRLLLNF